MYDYNTKPNKTVTLFVVLQPGAMAAGFPFRGLPPGMPPGVLPPASMSEYMTEEKLQEKGIFFCCFKTFRWNVNLTVCFLLSTKMAATAGKTLRRKTKIWLC